MLNVKKITLMCFLAGFLPITAYGTMVYNPSQPCGNCAGGKENSDGSCLPNYVENDTNRNFQRIYGEPQHQLKKIKKQKLENDVKIVNKATTKKNTKSAKSAKGVGDVYLAGNLVWNMWSWDNEYRSDYNGADVAYDKDKYSLKSVIGVFVALGTGFGKNLRGDLEFGFSQKFTDSDDTATFKMSLPYLMANVYRDFDSGFYLGGGIGVARPQVTIALDLNSLPGTWLGDDVKKSAVVPKFGASVGYVANVSDSTSIDFRYRFSVIRGASASQRFLWSQYDDGYYDEYFLHLDTGWTVENSLSVGLRYNF